MRSKLIVALLITTLLSFALWSQRGAAASETVTSYEYHIITDSWVDGDKKQLKELGAQGWELVGVATYEKNDMTILYLKRTRKSG